VVCADARIKTMPRVTLVRYTTKPERAAENEALSRAVFAELRTTRPDHIAYGLFRSGEDFVHVFLNLESDDSSPVTELTSFKAFERGGPERWSSPPEVTRLSMDLVEAYGLAGALATA
jgi:hypothetical protein